MKMRITLLIMLVLAFTISCNNTRRISTSRLPFEVQFGRTGGFTNIPVEYKLNNKGDVFKISGTEMTKINDISRKRIKTIKELLNRIDFEHLKFCEPGNMSYNIKVITSDYENSVTWNDQTPDDILKNLYKELLTTIKP